MKSKNLTPSYHEWRIVEETQVAHLAGAFDMAGNVTVKITKSNSNKIGFKITPNVTFSRPDSEDPIFGKLMEYAEDNRIQYQLYETERSDYTSVSCQFTHRESIKRLLDSLLEYLVTNYTDAMIMLTEIIPAIEEEKHLTKQGFYNLMEYADELRDGGRGSPVKYDQQFFANEFSL